MVYFKDSYAHAMTWALIESRYREAGLGWADHQARFYGMPSGGISAARERLKDRLMNRSRFPVHDLSEEQLWRWWARWQKGDMDYFYGYTSVLSHIADWMVEQSLPGEQLALKQVILTSELCLPEDHQKIRRAFHRDPIREYGISELCLLGFDRQGRFDLNQETLLIEVLDDQGRSTDQEGEATVTSLFNRAYPLIRYQPGDLIRRGEAGGRYFIEEMKGRTSDLIHLPGGGRAAGLNFYYLARQMLMAQYPVTEFRVRQTRIDQLEIEYTSSRPLREEEKGHIRSWISDILGYAWTVQFHQLDQIPPHPLGKKQHFYCEISSR